MSKPTCLVLGGKGFVGSHLVDALLAQGYSVRVFDRPGVGFLEGACIQNPNLELVDGDLASDSDISTGLVGCDVCFHLVSTTLPSSSNLDPVFDIETNLIGTVKLLQHAVHQGVKKIVFLSSGGTIYGVPTVSPIPETHPTNPICSYGVIKLAIEKYLGLFHQLHGLEYAALRMSNLYGERQRTVWSQGAVGVFLGKCLSGERADIWGDGSVIRDYLHISDAVRALVAAVEFKAPECVLNIGSGTGISLNDVLSEIEYGTGRKINRRYVESRAFDVPVSVLSITRAREVLQWEPRVSFREGISRTLNWLGVHRSSYDSAGI